MENYQEFTSAKIINDNNLQTQIKQYIDNIEYSEYDEDEDGPMSYHYREFSQVEQQNYMFKRIQNHVDIQTPELIFNREVINWQCFLSSIFLTIHSIFLFFKFIIEKFIDWSNPKKKENEE